MSLDRRMPVVTVELIDAGIVEQSLGLLLETFRSFLTAAKHDEQPLVATIDCNGITAFNCYQAPRLAGELRQLSRENPQVESVASAVLSLLTKLEEDSHQQLWIICVDRRLGPDLNLY